MPPLLTHPPPSAPRPWRRLWSGCVLALRAVLLSLATRHPARRQPRAVRLTTSPVLDTGPTSRRPPTPPAPRRASPAAPVAWRAPWAPRPKNPIHRPQKTAQTARWPARTPTGYGLASERSPLIPHPTSSARQVFGAPQRGERRSAARVRAGRESLPRNAAASMSSPPDESPRI